MLCEGEENSGGERERECVKIETRKYGNVKMARVTWMSEELFDL